MLDYTDSASFPLCPQTKFRRSEIFRDCNRTLLYLRHLTGLGLPRPAITQEVTLASLRDSNGISELSLIQLISPYKISCNRVSLEIPLLTLSEARVTSE